ncbi:MAG: hypothetical protein OHK93_003325 [Ramalina farinacea]|uniref:Uncharacterized protein n=1 Tax=Ramalina farinacea TaxID=258253 RepID=A0AA43QWB7_9LECA|nr:hypothetical protein [Ramalina farinacea]
MSPRGTAASSGDDIGTVVPLLFATNPGIVLDYYEMSSMNQRGRMRRFRAGGYIQQTSSRKREASSNTLEEPTRKKTKGSQEEKRGERKDNPIFISPSYSDGDDVS